MRFARLPVLPREHGPVVKARPGAAHDLIDWRDAYRRATLNTYTPTWLYADEAVLRQLGEAGLVHFKVTNPGAARVNWSEVQREVGVAPRLGVM